LGLDVVEIGAGGNLYADVGEAFRVARQAYGVVVGEERVTGRAGGGAGDGERARFAVDDEGDPGADLPVGYDDLTGARCATGGERVRRERSARPVVSFADPRRDSGERVVAERTGHARHGTDLGQLVDRDADALGQRGGVLFARAEVGLVAGDNER